MSGTEIRALRETMGLSLEKFASKIGVSSRTIFRWEHNQATPSPMAERLIKKMLNKNKGVSSEGS